MADRAHVTSVEAIAAFRANLILYLNKARPTVEEVSNEVLRTRFWLQTDKRRYWEHEAKVRGRALEEAQQEMFGAMLSKLRSVTAELQRNVHQAKHAVDEADTKLAALKRWDRELESRSEPMLKQVDQLQGFLTGEMVRAVAYLAQVVKTLDAYAGVALPGEVSDLDETPKQTDENHRAETESPPARGAGAKEGEAA